MTLDLTATPDDPSATVDLLVDGLSRYTAKPDTATLAEVAAGSVTTGTTATETAETVILTTTLSSTVRRGRLTRSIATTGLSLGMARFLVQVRTASTAAKVRAYATGQTPGSFQDVTPEWTWLRHTFPLVADPQAFGLEVHPLSPFQEYVDVELRFWRVRGYARMSDPVITRDDGISVPLDVHDIEAALEHGGASYPDTVLANTPAAYWRLDEASGTTLTDSSGNGRDLVAGGAIGFSQAALVNEGTSAQFGASYGYGAALSASWMNLGTSWSVEFWLQSTDTGGGRLIGRDQPGGSQYWSFQIVGAGKIYFVNNHGTVVVVGSTTSTSLLDGSPHHFVATGDGTNVRFYVDGALDTTIAYGYALGYAGGPFALDLTLGSGYLGASRFEGLLDEVAIYDTTLTTDDVADHYAAAVSVVGSGGAPTSDTLPAHDRAAPLGRLITYTAIDAYDPPGATPPATDTDTATLDLPGPLLSDPGTDADPAAPAFVLDLRSGGEPQLELIRVLNRPDPVPVLTGGSLRTGTVSLFFATYPAALACLRLALAGRVLLLRQSTLDGADMRLVTTRADLTRASGSEDLDSPPWVVALDYAEVLP